MPTQLELMQEAYNRGILPPDKVELYEEAVRRGLVGGEPKEMAWGDVATQAVSNIPSSAQAVGESMWHAVTHPVDTAKAVVDLGAGALQHAVGAVSPEALEFIGKDEGSYDIASKVGQALVDRYGSIEAAKKTLATDPVGALLDVSSVAGIGSVTLPGRAGSVAQKVAAATDPISLTGKAVSGAVGLAGKGLKEVAGKTTGVGSEAIQTAYQAGKAGEESGAAFRDSLTGRASMTNILDAAKQNLQAMIAERGRQYQAGMEKIKGDASVLEFGGIDDALARAAERVSFKGEIVDDAAAGYLQQIVNEVEKWKSLDPAEFHTPMGLDALKRRVGAIREQIPIDAKNSGAIAKSIYGSIKDEIQRQAPSYAKVMKGYEEASSTIKEIERTLSLNPNASVDTAMRKLQSLMRNNVNTTYGHRLGLAKEMEAAGGKEMMPSLAGQSMSEWMPRGIQGAVSPLTSLGGYSVGGLPAAAAMAVAQSPRAVGEAAYWSGKAAGGAGKLADAIPEIIADPRMRAALYQSGNIGLLEQVLGQE